MLSKTETFLLVPFIFASLLLYIVLAFNNRLSHDDLMYLYAVKKYGLIQASVQNYSTWNTRWAGLFLANAFFSISIFTENLWLFHFFTLAAIIFSSAILLKQGVNYFMQTEICIKQATMYGFAFAALLFANTFSAGDVWFWMNASCMFLWNVIACCLAFSLMLKNRISLSDKFFIAVFGLFTGGCSEPFSILMMAVLTTVLFIVRIIKKNKVLTSGIGLLLVFILTGFVISYAGTGNEMRRSALPHTDLLYKQWIYIKVMGKFILFAFPQKLILSVILSFPFYLFGSKIGKRNARKFSIIKMISYSLIATIIAAAITFYPIVYLMSESGPERSWTGISFFMSIFFATVFFMAGSMQIISARAEKIYSSVFIFFIVCIFALAINQYTTTTCYASAYDRRVNYLLELKRQNFKKTASLQPLPSPGMLHSAEISEDSSFFTNKQLKLFYDLPFELIRGK